MNLKQVLADPPTPHKDLYGQFVLMGLSEDVMSFVSERINSESQTLETGCGISTVMFALTGSHHVAISPLRHEFEIIKAYCHERNIPTDRINFIPGASQRILPSLDSSPLDVVLIDGLHGFPAPYIDWFYTADKLKVGGLLVIDDTWIWTCQVLKDVLSQQPEWEVVADFPPRTTIFKKLGEGSESLDWTHQPFVARNGYIKFIDGKVQAAEDEAINRSTAINRTLNHLRRGEFSMLLQKVLRRVSG